MNMKKPRIEFGMTLIEVLIYTAMLSFLLSGYIRYAFDLHWSDLKLQDDIYDAFRS